MRKGLTVSVLKDTGLGSCDCTAGGASSKQDDFVLVGEDGGNLNSPFTVEDGEVYLQVIKRFLFGRNYYHVEPYKDGRPLMEGKGLIGPMAGGNFVWSSDSRFPNDYPLAIHDRFETQEVYDALSR